MFTMIFQLIETGSSWIALVALALAFMLLAKSADFFVDNAVGLATRFHVPRIVIGLVLVSFATTAPELSVSLMAARHGNPEMALGNAIGSVICNCGVALGLCGLLSRKPVPVLRRVLHSAGAFLLLSSIAILGFVWNDHVLGRLEGLSLLAFFFVYLGLLFRQYKTGKMKESEILDDLPALVSRSVGAMLFGFLLGLGGVILASRFVVVSAVTLATRMGIPESMIALTLVALGTSIPEVATSITAAIKGEGALSVGNILGANIMNICWVAGASAIANPLSITSSEMGMMFPALFLMVIVTLVLLHTHEVLMRWESAVLVAGYGAYVVSFFVMLN